MNPQPGDSNRPNAPTPRKRASNTANGSAHNSRVSRNPGARAAGHASSRSSVHAPKTPSPKRPSVKRAGTHASGAYAVRKNAASKPPAHPSRKEASVRTPHKEQAPAVPARSKRPPKAALALVAVLAAVLIAWGLDQILTGDKIHAGVHVGEVDVSGMTVDQAASAIGAVYSPRFDEAKTVLFADEDAKAAPVVATKLDDLSLTQSQIQLEASQDERRQWTMTPAQVGASFDPRALASEAFEVGRANGGLFARAAAAAGGWDVPAVCSLDPASIEATCNQITDDAGSRMENSSVSMEGTQPLAHEGHDGREVMPEWVSGILATSFLAQTPESHIIEFTDVPATIDFAQAQRVADSIRGTVDAGAEFTLNGSSIQVNAEELASWVATRIVNADGTPKLEATLDAKKLQARLLPPFSHIDDPDGLTVRFHSEEDGVQVSSNATGTMPDLEKLAQQATDELFTGTARTKPYHADLVAVSIPERLSFDQALHAGIVEEIERYETTFSSGNVTRVHNIKLAARLLVDSVCPADGGTWSFNDIAGEATPEKGYQGAGTVMDGEVQDSIGGGICQVATTVFNAVYEAGYPIDRRYNHSLYLPNYPDGRDAAIAYSDMDLAWHNDTSSDVLVKTEATDESLAVILHGVDPHRDVSTEVGEWKQGAAFNTRYIDDDTLSKGKEYEVSPGANGSEITITRTVKDAQGSVIEQTAFTSTYQSKDRVIARGTK